MALNPSLHRIQHVHWKRVKSLWLHKNIETYQSSTRSRSTVVATCKLWDTCRRIWDGILPLHWWLEVSERDLRIACLWQGDNFCGGLNNIFIYLTCRASQPYFNLLIPHECHISPCSVHCTYMDIMMLHFICLALETKLVLKFVEQPHLNVCPTRMVFVRFAPPRNHQGGCYTQIFCPMRPTSARSL